MKTLVYSKTETDSLLSSKASSSHTHTKSQITDFPAYGTTEGTICQGNDSRLSDARTPTSHTHTKSQITDFPSLATVATSGSYNDLSNKPSFYSKSEVDTLLAAKSGFVTSTAIDVSSSLSSVTMQQGSPPNSVTYVTGKFIISTVDGFVSARYYNSNNSTVSWRLEVFRSDSDMYNGDPIFCTQICTENYGWLTLPVVKGAYIRVKLTNQYPPATATYYGFTVRLYPYS